VRIFVEELSSIRELGEISSYNLVRRLGLGRNENYKIIPSNMKTKLKVLAVALMTGAALGCVTGLSLSCTRHRASALKPKSALQTMVDTTAKELLIPGAVVLLRTPQGEFTVSYGTTVLGATSPPSEDTHFRIASNTKTMTAAVIVLLAQEEKLSLDDPVSKYVPDVPNGDRISITDLLKMRSGLYNYTNDPIISKAIDTDPARVWTPAELLAIAFAHQPNFPPGKQYDYNNTNYVLLGLIAETVDGKPLAQIMHDRLFGPHNMQDTELPSSTVNTIREPYFARVPVRQLFGRIGGRTALLARSSGCRTSWHASAEGLYGCEPFQRRGRWRCHFHGRRSRDLDKGTGRRQGVQRRLSAPLVRQLATRGPKQAQGPKVRVRHRPT